MRIVEKLKLVGGSRSDKINKTKKKDIEQCWLFIESNI